RAPREHGACSGPGKTQREPEGPPPESVYQHEGSNCPAERCQAECGMGGMGQLGWRETEGRVASPEQMQQTNCGCNHGCGIAKEHDALMGLPAICGPQPQEAAPSSARIENEPRYQGYPLANERGKDHSKYPRLDQRLLRGGGPAGIQSHRPDQDT